MFTISTAPAALVFYSVFFLFLGNCSGIPLIRAVTLITLSKIACDPFLYFFIALTMPDIYYICLWFWPVVSSFRVGLCLAYMLLCLCHLESFLAHLNQVPNKHLSNESKYNLTLTKMWSKVKLPLITYFSLFLTALLRYNLCLIPFTHLQYKIQWLICKIDDKCPMHEAGKLKAGALGNPEGGGRGVQDGGTLCTCGWFMSRYAKDHHNTVKKLSFN